MAVRVVADPAWNQRRAAREAPVAPLNAVFTQRGTGRRSPLQVVAEDTTLESSDTPRGSLYVGRATHLLGL